MYKPPSLTQRYNRYSYYLNNPLKYTDPSGDNWRDEHYASCFEKWGPKIAVFIGALVVSTVAVGLGANFLVAGVLCSTLTNVVNTRMYGGSVEDCAKSAIIGAFTGAITSLTTAGIMSLIGKLPANPSELFSKMGRHYIFDLKVYRSLADVAKNTALSTVAKDLTQGIANNLVTTTVASVYTSTVIAQQAVNMYNFTDGFVGVGFGFAQAGGGGYITNWDIANNALGYVGSSDWALGRSKGDFGHGDFKCNLFVYDVLTKTGVSPGLPNQAGFFARLLGHGPYPPSAGQWANSSYSIPGWRVLGSNEFPMSGDIAAIGHNSLNATGHVGIVFYNGRTISQSAITNRVSISSWGFNPGDATVFRRYTGY